MFFFFQAEDGIRDLTVTGVQTCALPISGELAKVAEIRYGKIAAAERDLKQAQERFSAVQKDAPMLKEEVDEEDIAKLVSKWTGIPVGRLLEGEAQKLVHMEERLRQRGVGPDAR